MITLIEQSDGSTNSREAKQKLFESVSPSEMMVLASMVAVSCGGMLSKGTTSNDARAALSRVANIMDGISAYDKTAQDFRDLVADPNAFSELQWIDMCFRFSKMLADQTGQFAQYAEELKNGA